MVPHNPIPGADGAIPVPPRPVPTGLTFGGIAVPGYHGPRYPRMLYKDGEPPRKVSNETEEAAAAADGYDAVSASVLSNKYLINWVWDLEDMSPRQLRVFARDEYGVELPEDATQETLYRCVLKLAKHAPQNSNRLVLMAHTVKMNYDATLEEIRRLQGENVNGVETETIELEIWA